MKGIALIAVAAILGILLSGWLLLSIIVTVTLCVAGIVLYMRELHG